MADTGQVGLQLQGDGQTINIRVTNDGSVIVQEGSGKYLEYARRAQSFVAISTTAVIINSIGSAATYPILWNPIQYNKIVIPLLINIQPTSTPATVANYPTGGFCIANITNAQAGINATYLSTLTNNAALTTQLGGVAACSSQWSATAGVGTTGVATRFFDLGLTGSNGNLASVPGTTQFGNWSYDVQGAFILRPGAAMALAQSGTAGATSTFHISILFAEIPAPAGF
jgi:hypothetical protein